VHGVTLALVRPVWGPSIALGASLDDRNQWIDEVFAVQRRADAMLEKRAAKS
jgi:hypothetical protein